MAEYLRAFWTLCGRRTYGMGPNPISFLDLTLYFSMYEMDDFEEFETLICKMDEKWMSFMATRKKK